ncbi:MAG: hypothetical protein IIA83_13090 [Thaumarchaeota archaeon]|nr:hypothetical protein [Nitrososphaerota archaeon]
MTKAKIEPMLREINDKIDVIIQNTDADPNGIKHKPSVNTEPVDCLNGNCKKELEDGS